MATASLEPSCTSYSAVCKPEESSPWGAPVMGAVSTPELVLGQDDETIETALNSLEHVRAASRKSGHYEENVVCVVMMGMRLLQDNLNRSYVGRSRIHGDGLFAGRNIDQGELITFFPGDAVIIQNYEGKNATPILMFGDHIPKAQRNGYRFRDVLAKNYSLYVKDKISAIGDPDRRNCSAYLGHFANDASTCPSPDDQDRYMNESIAGANAEPIFLDESHFAIVATRPILKDDEVLYSYGAGYWLERNGHPNVPRADIGRRGTSHIMTEAVELRKELLKERMKKPKNNTKTSSKAKLRKKADTKSVNVKGFGVRKQDEAKNISKDETTVKDRNKYGKFIPEVKQY